MAARIHLVGCELGLHVFVEPHDILRAVSDLTNKMDRHLQHNANADELHTQINRDTKRRPVDVQRHAHLVAARAQRPEDAIESCVLIENAVHIGPLRAGARLRHGMHVAGGWCRGQYNSQTRW